MADHGRINQREMLRRVIGGVLFNVNNYPAAAQRYIAGSSTQLLNDRLTEALLKAGFVLSEPVPKLCNYGGCTYLSDHTKPKEHSWE